MTASRRAAALAAVLLPVRAAFAGPAAPVRPDMSKEPVVGEVRPYKAPPRTESALPNGLRLVVLEDRRFPLVTARLAVRVGAASVPAEDAGHAEAMAALLTEGAGPLSAKQIADEADAVGGEIRASADSDHVVVGGYALSEHAERLLRLLSRVALEPTFPADEVELRKKNMRDELELNRSQSGFLAGVALAKRLYAGHPYAVTAPTEASIGRISRERLAALHRAAFAPDGAVLILAGDIDAARARKTVEELFGSWQAGSERLPEPPAVARSSATRRVYLVDRPGSAQTAFQIGARALPEAHPDFYALRLANQVLGGSFSARLMIDLREKKGYTYGIYSRLPTLLRGGAFVVRTQVRTEVTADALKDILAHLERLRAEPVTAAELRQAKNYLAGSFTRGLETQEGVADQLLHAILHGLPPDHLETFVQKTQAVSAAAALEAAKAYVVPEFLVIVAVGDAAKIREGLSAFSDQPVQLLDVNGD